jgi:hypothetical protein
LEFDCDLELIVISLLRAGRFIGYMNWPARWMSDKTIDNLTRRRVAKHFQ